MKKNDQQIDRIALEELLRVTAPPPQARWVGTSRDGRDLPAWRFGRGPRRLSLIAGCHADEPAGPLLLRKLVAWLGTLPAEHTLLTEYAWLIIPHTNPDGEARNRAWQTVGAWEHGFRLSTFLRHVHREPPADDLEFGFPLRPGLEAKRPENAFVYGCWQDMGGPFDLHLSLHSMAISFGAWYLLEPSWAERSKPLRAACAEATQALGYPLMDLDRGGEKGFFRIARGFATRPNYLSMRDFFLAQEDERQARYFHASSMDSIRSLGGDCCCMVTELPNFLLPEREGTVHWPDADYQAWKQRLEKWKAELHLDRISGEEVEYEARRLGLRPMPLRDQMALQWRLIQEGLRLIT